MKLKRSLYLSLATSLLSSTALAADLPEPVVAPPPASAFSWTGFHAGVGVGGGIVSADTSSSFGINVDDGGGWSDKVPDYMDIGVDDLGSNFGFGTLEIGYDWQFNSFVLGALASYDFSGDAKSRADAYAYEDKMEFEQGIKTSLDDTWFIGGRFGFVTNQRTLWYGLLGYSQGEARVRTLLGFDGDDGDDYGQVKKKDDVGGATLGVGVEHAVTQNVSLKLEYRHDFLDSVKWDEVPFDPEWEGFDDGNRSRGKVDFSRDTVRAVASWRYNSNAPSEAVFSSVPAYDWTGFHAGAGVGGGIVQYDAYSAFEIDPWDDKVPEFMDIRAEKDQLFGFGTVEGGYDLQFGSFVLGALASFDFGDSAGSSASALTLLDDGDESIEQNIHSSLENVWMVGGRAGLAVNHTLFYGLAGWSQGEGQVRTLLGFDVDAGDDYGQVKKKDDVGGAMLGVGVEHAVTQNISLKLEYRHDFLDSVKWNEVPFDPEWEGFDDDNTSSGKVDFSRDTVRAVASWRF